MGLLPTTVGFFASDMVKPFIAWLVPISPHLRRFIRDLAFHGLKTYLFEKVGVVFFVLLDRTLSETVIVNLSDLRVFDKRLGTIQSYARARFPQLRADS